MHGPRSEPTRRDRAGLRPLPCVEDPWTIANQVTLVRTVGALAVGVVASVQGSLGLLLVAYLIYWVGDVADGQVARRTGTLTRQGAVLDILSDRACCGLLAAVFLGLRPEAAPAIGVFLFQFMVVDCILSLGFLRWPILSPNDFGQVDRTLYRWNWHPVAKAINTAGLVLVVLTGVYDAALVLACAQLVVKSVSLVGMTRLLAQRPGLATAGSPGTHRVPEPHLTTARRGAAGAVRP